MRKNPKPKVEVLEAPPKEISEIERLKAQVERLQDQIGTLEANHVALHTELHPLPPPPKAPGRIFTESVRYNILTRRGGGIEPRQWYDEMTVSEVIEEKAKSRKKMSGSNVIFVPWDIYRDRQGRSTGLLNCLREEIHP